MMTDKPYSEEIMSKTINEIISAFKGVSREGGISLHETSVIDDYGSDAERAEARTKDTETNWQDVPDSTIEELGLSLSFLDPIGFRYYIPAYMLWQLRQFSGVKWVDCNAHDAALYGLTLDLDARMREWKLPYFELFTPEQSRAVCSFLHFYVEYVDEYVGQQAQQALDRYWGTFDQISDA